jgi:hypothetical protein
VRRCGSAHGERPQADQQRQQHQEQVHRLVGVRELAAVAEPEDARAHRQQRRQPPVGRQRPGDAHAEADGRERQQQAGADLQQLVAVAPVQLGEAQQVGQHFAMAVVGGEGRRPERFAEEPIDEPPRVGVRHARRQARHGDEAEAEEGEAPQARHRAQDRGGHGPWRRCRSLVCEQPTVERGAKRCGPVAVVAGGRARQDLATGDRQRSTRGTARARAMARSWGVDPSEGVCRRAHEAFAGQRQFGQQRRQVAEEAVPVDVVAGGRLQAGHAPWNQRFRHSTISSRRYLAKQLASAVGKARSSPRSANVTVVTPSAAQQPVDDTAGSPARPRRGPSGHAAAAGRGA